MQNSKSLIIDTLKWLNPQAIAYIRGGEAYPKLNGHVKFYSLPLYSTLIEAEIFYLPDDTAEKTGRFFGFHIHENGDCSNQFADTGNHYNPDNTPHPCHAGDLPPLMSNQGYAWTAFYDARITIPEIIGRSVIIHDMPDDFTTQLSGNSGEKIACGVIEAFSAT